MRIIRQLFGSIVINFIFEYYSKLVCAHLSVTEHVCIVTLSEMCLKQNYIFCRMIVAVTRPPPAKVPNTNREIWIRHADVHMYDIAILLVLITLHNMYYITII